MMGMFMHFLLVLLTILVLIQAQQDDQSGFISLDCGQREDVRYSASRTGINYRSDANFIDTGESKRVQVKIPKSAVKQELQYVRSFPSGVRNCYRINVTSGTKYFIRATFAYGNYDNRNQAPQFDLYLGVNLWRTMYKQLLKKSFATSTGMIYTPSLDYIQLCLVNTGNGIPFISVIELRPLNSSIYPQYSPNSALLTKYRYDLGSIITTDSVVYRYKDDVYDRFWSPYELSSDFLRISTNVKNVDQSLLHPYKPPAIVMSSAVTPVNASAPLELEWEVDNVNDQYYFYLYFYEVEELAANETRKFNITHNDKLWFGPLTPLTQPGTVQPDRHLTGKKTYRFSLFKTHDSTLPPILNAVEVYQVKDFSQSETKQDDIDSITNIKKAYRVDKNWQGDPCAPVNYMWEGLNCIPDGNNIPRITSLNLSSSDLTGKIDSSFSKLTMLEYLDLSNNSLTGPLPDFLIQLRSLKVFRKVGKNKLTGLVPDELLERSKKGSLSLSTDDNPGLCMTESCGKKSSQSHVPLIASISAIIVVILLISLGFWIFRRQKVMSTNSKKRGSLESKHQAFSYTEILNITDNFKTIIGQGGFGKVYLGVLQNHAQVAVKILSLSSMQGYKEFQSEAQLLMIVHHRNLVSLIGYCDEVEIKALVYEYMANGNLHQQLSVKNTNILKWNERLNIAVDAAQGLDYLHNGCKPPIMHRDLKPSNILLDENMHAKIADFGLSRAFGNDIDSHISTNPAGTRGYVDPEFQRTGKANKKNDVYSFGIVLFVLITGRPAIVREGGETIHILEWAIPIIEEGDIQNVIDPRLEGEFSINSAWKFVEIAMSCTLANAVVERPDMSFILAELKECQSLDMVRRNFENTGAIDELVSLATVSDTTISAR
ncbi:probable LRR receptor-like serine/threonine-protein kinase At1g05700 isoform X1 [Trifolium pratense]|uniref:probable LRR receptor-like serine/threonine-protein kinase At1g05700 isoform X1 n=2 Tax=Trifolium pratense TaxID=57577 RepID=UPI001E69530A|nr:probable LRR receptor-like serine/threonine-protein kinase At1g05700 isoform X1 [Trifolium pratense]